jgi:phosphoserine phosphatase RsbU/P
MAESEARPRLIIRDAAGRRTISIDKPTLTFGRRSESDVRLTGTDVSRLHAEITIREGQARLRDAGSRFGTYVNGVRINEQDLRSGDVIRFGQGDDVEVTFETGEQSEHSTVSAVADLRQMAVLLEGLRALGSGRVLDEVLALVLDSAIDVTGAERGFIMLANDERRLEFKLARARGKMSLPGQTFELSRKIPEQVFATGVQAIVEDLQDGDLAQLHMGTIALGIRHVLCSPLRLVRYVERADQRLDAEQIIGVLYLDSRERGALRAASTRAALETLSAEAALAIENARLYREALDKAAFEQELNVAAAIQRAMLPVANRAGVFFSAAAATVPCRAVGGDFFDYADLSAGRFGFILGDVAGKGPSAALLAAAMLGMFSAEATYHDGAATLMSRLNEGLLRRAIEARYLTTFYGVLSPDGRLICCNAGHNPPLLVSAGGIRRLETGGVVLGLFAHAPFEEECVTLEPGDFVVVFSDGVSEARDQEGLEYGDDRLIACASRARAQSPQDLLDAILADVRTFCGDTPQGDDITVVAIRYNG